MCPDVEAFAPLVEATFGPAPRCRRRTAGRGPPRADAARPDRRPRRCGRRNPVLAVLADAARARRLAGHRVGRWSTSRPGAGAPAVRVRRRRPRPGRAVGARVGGALGRGPAPAGALRLPDAAAGHLGAPRWTGSCSASRWPRRTSGSSARCCRSTTWTATTSTWSGGSPSSSTGSPASSPSSTVPSPSGTWFDPLDRAVGPAHRRRHRRTAGSSSRPRRSWRTLAVRETQAAARILAAAGGRRALLAARLAGRPDPRGLPHRRADRVLARADARGAAPGGRLLGMDDGAFPRGTSARRRRRPGARPAASVSATGAGGPPALPRRGDRAAEHLVVAVLGCRRAHRCAAPARGPGRRAARRARRRRVRTGRPTGPRARRGPAPAADRRRAQLRRRRPRPTGPFSFDALDLRGGAGRPRRAARPGRPSCPARCRPTATRAGRPRRPGARPRAPRARVRRGGGSACRCRGTSRSSTTGCRWSWTASTAGRSATGCWAPAGRGATRRVPWRPSGAAVTCRRASSAGPRCRGRRRRSSRSSRPPRRFAVGPARVVDVRADLPDGCVLTGTVHGVHGDVLRAHGVLPGVRPSTGCAPGSSCWRSSPSEPDGALASRHGRAARRAARPARPRSGCAPPTPRAAQRLEELVRLRDGPPASRCRCRSTRRGLRAAAGPPVTPRSRRWRTPRRTWQERVRDGATSTTSSAGGWAHRWTTCSATPSATEQAWWPQDSSRLGVLARRVWQPLLDRETSQP